MDCAIGRLASDATSRARDTSGIESPWGFPCPVKPVTRVGADLVHLAYLDATGQPLPAERLRGQPGWAWVNTDFEMGFPLEEPHAGTSGHVAMAHPLAAEAHSKLHGTIRSRHYAALLPVVAFVDSRRPPHFAEAPGTDGVKGIRNTGTLSVTRKGRPDNRRL